MISSLLIFVINREWTLLLRTRIDRINTEYTVSLFFNDISKIPIVNKMIFSQDMISNIYSCGMYHKPNSIFKSKSQDFHNKNIGTFSGNETRVAGCFIGMQRDLQMRKVLQPTILFA